MKALFVIFLLAFSLTNAFATESQDANCAAGLDSNDRTAIDKSGDQAPIESSTGASGV